MEVLGLQPISLTWQLSHPLEKTACLVVVTMMRALLYCGSCMGDRPTKGRHTEVSALVIEDLRFSTTSRSSWRPDFQNRAFKFLATIFSICCECKSKSTSSSQTRCRRNVDSV
ncbi:UNVERIFIED_CONTAM: hypothetical protein Sindi_0887800 [Sesamum indicum]